jgi:arylsulfatase A-like enzyme
MVVRWPGVVKPGSVTGHISAFWDVMPTLCEIAGAPMPAHTDGISFVPTLKGEEQTPHEFLYWEFNENIHLQKGEYKQAVRMGKWKGIYYINDDRFELYDLNDDIAETRNVANENLEIVSQIRRIMKEQHTPSERFPLLKNERR